jgi:PD-(D/E)XK nuclease superfamily protein
MPILDFTPDLPPRESFIGTLQVLWDSTSLSTFLDCPYKYYLAIICGVIPQGDSVHLKFGILYHKGQEYYQKARCRGLIREDAIYETLRYILTATWEPRLNRPWISLHETKNRYTLVRTLLDYFDFYNDEADTYENVLLPGGRPAVELSFQFPTNYETPTGAPYKICGHIDRLVSRSGRLGILDYKTTSMPLSETYWNQFKLNNQLSLYHFSGQIVFNVRISEMIVDAVQIKKDGSEFQRRGLPQTEDQLNEWYVDFGYSVAYAETCSKQNYWPRNRKSCVKGYLTCEYISICSNCPGTRGTWMKTGWSVRQPLWDPAVARGDE